MYEYQDHMVVEAASSLDSRVLWARNTAPKGCQHRVIRVSRVSAYVLDIGLQEATVRLAWSCRPHLPVGK